MRYTLLVEEDLIRTFDKIKKKDSLQAEILKRKITEILENPYRFKPLRGNMKNQRRVHIRNFVLTYEILEQEKTVHLLDYDHHDKIYEK